MKVINDLLGYDDFKIVQNPEWFSFSLDSVLLPKFVTINKDVKNILDLGTGNAPIPIILTTITEKANIYGIEIQKDVYEMAKESIKINNLESRIKIINDDMKKLDQYFEANFFDVIVSNPPYFKLEELSKKNDDEHKTIARHEEKITLSELIQIAKKYLKNNGVFAMVHRTDRLIEIIEEMRKNNIEPKKIQLIYPKQNSNSNMVLIEGKKNGNPGLIIKEPLIIHDENGEYLEDIKKIFFRR